MAKNQTTTMSILAKLQKDWAGLFFVNVYGNPFLRDSQTFPETPVFGGVVDAEDIGCYYTITVKFGIGGIITTQKVEKFGKFGEFYNDYEAAKAWYNQHKLINNIDIVDFMSFSQAIPVFLDKPFLENMKIWREVFATYKKFFETGLGDNNLPNSWYFENLFEGRLSYYIVKNTLYIRVNSAMSAGLFDIVRSYFADLLRLTDSRFEKVIITKS